jgi:hypothetical protein
VEHFVARVFDVGRSLGGSPFASFLSSGFAVENRPTEPQDANAMASYLRGRRSKGEPFIRTVADLQCATIRPPNGPQALRAIDVLSLTRHRAAAAPHRRAAAAAHASSDRRRHAGALRVRLLPSPAFCSSSPTCST